MTPGPGPRTATAGAGTAGETVNTAPVPGSVAAKASGRPPPGASPPAVRERLWGWVDWLAGTDPGWMRLRLAGQVVIAIALAVE
jgi:hypothetical protein